jgi:hypothetical protein
MKCLVALFLFVWTAHAQPKAHWRSATPRELELALPVRAEVEKDRIEVEMRTASGIIDQRGRVIAGVVLITAGYSAEGKYSHFLLAQSPFILGDLHLAAGNYVLGWRRAEDSLQISIYEAATGIPKGTVIAVKKTGRGARVESFRIWPPGSLSEFQIGRFFLHYAPDE